MGRSRDWGVIVIKEDAYKQNSVYRPWDETNWVEPKPLADKRPIALDTASTQASPEQKAAYAGTP